MGKLRGTGVGSDLRNCPGSSVMQERVGKGVGGMRESSGNEAVSEHLSLISNDTHICVEKYDIDALEGGREGGKE